MEENENMSYNPIKLSGILLGLFLGIFGFVLGLAIYQKQDDRNSFISACTVALILNIIISIIAIIIFFGIISDGGF